MKKAILISIILSVLAAFPMSVSAAPGPKDIEVTLSDIPEAINTGEKVELTAISVKHGSSYNDNWSNAAELSSRYDTVSGCYVSSAVFTAGKPGTYTIRYAIQMTAGNSNTTFFKEVEKTIKVINSITVIGARIQDLVVKPVYRTDGSIYSYSAFGKVYALWSDGTATPSGSAFFFFGINELAKDVRVTIDADGKINNFVISVTR